MSIQDILTVAKELSVQERLQVAILLLESLKTSHPPEFQYVNVKHSEKNENLQELYIDYLEEKYS